MSGFNPNAANGPGAKAPGLGVSFDLETCVNTMAASLSVIAKRLQPLDKDAVKNFLESVSTSLERIADAMESEVDFISRQTVLEDEPPDQQK